MSQDMITAEVAPSSADRRSWMMIRPTEDGQVLLLEFEHLAGLDTDGYFAPDDVLDRKKSYFASLQDVIDSLESRGIDTDLFDAPWKMDYPL